MIDSWVSFSEGRGSHSGCSLLGASFWSVSWIVSLFPCGNNDQKILIARKSTTGTAYQNWIATKETIRKYVEINMQQERSEELKKEPDLDWRASIYYQKSLKICSFCSVGGGEGEMQTVGEVRVCGLAVKTVASDSQGDSYRITSYRRMLWYHNYQNAIKQLMNIA